MNKIDRREAIRRTVLIMGGTLSGSIITGVLSGCKNRSKEETGTKQLSLNQLETAAHLAEVILPSTDTPGAKEANIGYFIDRMITDWMSPKERKLALQWLNHLMQNKFANLTFEKQTQEVHQLLKLKDGREFFLLFKQITLLGFFTSETGATQVLQYDEIPGIYSGCEDLKNLKSTTWAT